VIHGVTVHDPYRWLENAASPKVHAWIDAQNAYADSVMGRFKDAAAITQRVRQLAITSTQQYAPQLVHGTLFFMRETPPQAQPVLVAQAWPGGAQRVLVDTNASGGHVSIQEVWPSPSGRYVAYGTSANGSEATTIHVVSAATGKILPDALADAGGGTTGPVVAWDADEQGLTYGRLPHGSLFGISLYHHVLGAPQSGDRPVFGRGHARPIPRYCSRRARTTRGLRPGSRASSPLPCKLRPRPACRSCCSRGAPPATETSAHRSVSASAMPPPR
jgi:prolyl oligopeptidase